MKAFEPTHLRLGDDDEHHQHTISGATWTQAWKGGTLSTQTALTLSTSSMTSGATVLGTADAETSGHQWLSGQWPLQQQFHLCTTTGHGAVT